MAFFSEDAETLFFRHTLMKEAPSFLTDVRLSGGQARAIACRSVPAITLDDGTPLREKAEAQRPLVTLLAVFLESA